ncbi:MAG: hypothetical protein HY000_31945 [Planctomycetes bacterium]|nr:hypothetical protein [Planctomycetota bacterium]
MPRYVVLHHVAPAGSERADHWDLMLEFGGSLRTWALPLPPEAGQTQIVDALPDHRLAYLEYEGPISGNRGRVTRWDAGLFDMVSASDSQLEIRLRGERLSCHAKLVRLAETSERWWLSLGKSLADQRAIT